MKHNFEELEEASTPDRITSKGLQGFLKRRVQDVISVAHQLFCKRSLPQKFGIYLHELTERELKLLEGTKALLERQGYRIVDLNTYCNSSDEKLVWVSFDDNYSGWLKHGDKLIQMGIESMFYVNTMPLDSGQESTYFDRIGGDVDRKSLSATELVSLHEMGHLIGAHTHSHYNLGKISVEMAIEEVEKNIKILCDCLKISSIEDFSFPFGMPRNFPSKLEKPIKELGITRIAHATPGMAYASLKEGHLHRNLWRSELSAKKNLRNVQIDGEWFVSKTGRSPIG